VPARLADVEMGEMRGSQRRYVSGGGRGVSLEREEYISTKGKIFVGIAIVVILGVLALVGVLGNRMVDRDMGL